MCDLSEYGSLTHFVDRSVRSYHTKHIPYCVFHTSSNLVELKRMHGGHIYLVLLRSASLIAIV